MCFGLQRIGGVAICIFAVCGALRGEVLELKDGRSVTGTIESRDDKQVVVQIPVGSTLAIPKKEIRSQTVGLHDTVILKDGSELIAEVAEETPTTIHYVVKKSCRMILPTAQLKNLKSTHSTGQPGATPPDTTPSAGASPGTAPAFDLSKVVKGKTLTLHFDNLPPAEAFKKLSEQYGYPIRWEGSPEKEKKISLKVENTPFLKVFSDLLQIGPWGFTEFQSADGNYIKVPETFTPLPTLQTDVKGPLMLVWHGLVTEEEMNFDKPGEKIKSTRYRLSLIEDPRFPVKTSIERSVRDEPIILTGPDGQRTPLQSEHNKNVFKSGPKGWEFSPRPEWSGKDMTLELSLPTALPTAQNSVTLPWNKDQKLNKEDVFVSIEQLSSGKKQKSNTNIHSPDFMKKYDVMEHEAIIRVTHAGANILEQCQRENRQPTEGELQKTKDYPMGGLVQVFDAVLVGEDRSEIPAQIKTSPGVHSPFHGFGFSLRWSTTNAAFVPREMRLSWLEKYQPFTVPFRLEKVRFDTPP
ncbi:MAG: hypothetical protein SFY92_08930 [Verrucomicrobiae bacterium]|nr:hypothetical protein [Verrucomicrobiae bacterium]